MTAVLCPFPGQDVYLPQASLGRTLTIAWEHAATAVLAQLILHQHAELEIDL
jgi:hypothetical protein